MEDPSRAGIGSRGRGRVVAVRELGGSEQVLVDFEDAPGLASMPWVPYQNLRYVRSIEQGFLECDTDGPSAAERLRLRTLAHALDLWHENTGALSRVDVDPLPHQIHVVQHILASGSLNWLMADDVGLGKTIEAGLLLKALSRRRASDPGRSSLRVLIVTPAGVTRQWKEELHLKFALSDFHIFGVDFDIQDPRDWHYFPRVIASMDRLKLDHHLERLLAADPWDVVLFDEGHRLTRRLRGRWYEPTERYTLAAHLRQRTNSLLLLTATPHQGHQDMFQSILKLLRPDLETEIDMLSVQPEILSQMVIRNSKADATDAEGQLIFKGKQSHILDIPASAAELQFVRDLGAYIEMASEHRQSFGAKAMAVGFVLTVYRKLAASSATAIVRALRRRLQRLETSALGARKRQAQGQDEEDYRFEGEVEQRRAEAEAEDCPEFFEGEAEVLESLLANADPLVTPDSKVEQFLHDLVGLILVGNPDERVVIFTEYRDTQTALQQALLARFGDDSVVLIHGGLNQQERQDAIHRFETSAQFLVSTEAGGEGINLHRQCHVMVNFDLPWNPMRLVQRTGRLYRYGQQHPVVVFNIRTPGSLDREVLAIMYQRLDQIVADMAVLGDEFNEALADDILGELVSVLDVDDILERSLSATPAQTQDELEAAFARAQAAVSQHRQLFEHAERYTGSFGTGALVMDERFLESFVRGMLLHTGCTVDRELHNGRLWEITITQTLADRLSTRRRRWRIALDRVWGANRSGVDVLDPDHPLLRCLLDDAKAIDYHGFSGGIGALPGVAAIGAVLRWQDQVGHRMRQEFSLAIVGSGATISLNDSRTADWLLHSVQPTERAPHPTSTGRWLRAAKDSFERRLHELATPTLHPASCSIVVAAWGSSEPTLPPA